MGGGQSYDINMIKKYFLFSALYLLVYIPVFSQGTLAWDTIYDSLNNEDDLYGSLMDDNAFSRDVQDLSRKKDRDLRGNGMEFIENKGQIADDLRKLHPDVLFVGTGGGTQVYLRKKGISYLLSSLPEEDDDDDGKKENINVINAGQRVDMDFIGSQWKGSLIKQEETEGYFNYYYPHCPQGITNVKAYNKVTYKNVYANIDIEYDGNKQNGLEYNFYVHPGGDPDDIVIRYSGAENVKVENEKLIVKTTIGIIEEWMPEIYQEINGEKIFLKGRYQFDEKSMQVRIEVDGYDHSRVLVIDPWATYCCGSTGEFSNGIAVDGTGNVLVTGRTHSLDFPATPGAFQTALNAPNSFGKADVFVIKFNEDGKRLWATFYGGSLYDFGGGIAIDKDDNVIITGSTESSDFPVLSAIQTTFAGKRDAFIVKFDADGNRSWASYLGGMDYDDGNNVGTDGNNDILVGGSTMSTDFPVLSAFQNIFAGGNYNGGDLFISKITSSGNLKWSTFYGGESNEHLNGMDVDKAGNIAVVSDFTVSKLIPGISSSSYLPVNSSGAAVIAKFDPNGNNLWATYFLGGTGDIAFDGTGNIITAGKAGQGANPGIPHDSTKALNAPGYADFYAVKFDPSGAPLWARYVGEASDGIVKTAVDERNNIYIFSDVGEIASENFKPKVNSLVTPSCAYQGTYGGNEDVFFAKLGPSGNHICSSFFGGPGEEDVEGYGDFTTHGDHIYFTAKSNMNGAPITPGAFQTTWKNFNIHVAKLCGLGCGSAMIPPDLNSDTTRVCSGQIVNYHGFLTTCDTSFIGTWQWSFPGGNPSVSDLQNPGNIIYNSPGEYPVNLTIKNSCTESTVLKNNYISVNSSGGNSDAGKDIIIKMGESGTLTASGGGSGVEYFWHPSEGLSCTNCPNPIASPNTTTTYYLEAECLNMDSVTVYVQGLFIPNAFTPNGDGMNDVFLPQLGAGSISHYELRIYNRWGELLFNSTSVARGWDAKCRGDFVSEGIYVYVLKAELIDAHPVNETGKVAVIR